jgi:hypothetical protein
MEADQLEVRNLLERDTARPRTAGAAHELPRLREILRAESAATGTPAPGL